MPTKLTPEKLTAFCAALAETCNVGKACAAVDVSRYTAYKWRKEYPDFAEQWDDAMKAGLLVLEDEAHRRAFDGVDEPLTHQGQFTYLPPREDDIDLATGEPLQHRIATVKKYSDTLAIFLLKAHAPEKYRETSKVELSGHLAVGEMTDDDIRAELAALGATVLKPSADDSAQE